MFTGIVEEQGTVVELTELAGQAARITVRGPIVTADAAVGDSIAVSGVCLTVAELGAGAFTADVMGETLALTTIGELGAGTAVNLERAVRADGRLGGHIVSGHVDGVGTILERRSAQHWEAVRIGVPEVLARQLAMKGSVCADGVSLTITEVSPAADPSPWFEVSLIPTTLSATTLGRRAVGDQVNIETDVLAKYVARLMEAGPK